MKFFNAKMLSRIWVAGAAFFWGDTFAADREHFGYSVRDTCYVVSSGQYEVVNSGRAYRATQGSIEVRCPIIRHDSSDTGSSVEFYFDRPRRAVNPACAVGSVPHYSDSGAELAFGVVGANDYNFARARVDIPDKHSKNYLVSYCIVPENVTIYGFSYQD